MTTTDFAGQAAANDGEINNRQMYMEALVQAHTRLAAVENIALTAQEMDQKGTLTEVAAHHLRAAVNDHVMVANAWSALALACQRAPGSRF